MAVHARKQGKSKAKLESMSEEEFDKWILSEMDMCQCPDCTTYNECAKNTAERLYCVVMRSPFCIDSRKGCLCQDCPVFEELKFRNTYHCLNGAEITRKSKT